MRFASLLKQQRCGGFFLSCTSIYRLLLLLRCLAFLHSVFSTCLHCVCHLYLDRVPAWLENFQYQVGWGTWLVVLCCYISRYLPSDVWGTWRAIDFSPVCVFKFFFQLLCTVCFPMCVSTCLQCVCTLLLYIYIYIQISPIWCLRHVAGHWLTATHPLSYFRSSVCNSTTPLSVCLPHSLSTICCQYPSIHLTFPFSQRAHS